MSWVAPPTTEQMLEMYRQMLKIRLFEAEVLKGGENVAIHSCAGHEAVAVGVLSQLLSNEDLVVSNHRPWGHFLAKGGTLKESFAELMGKETGVSHGVGGEMHLSKPEIGFVQSTMIVGACLTMATGVALSIKKLNRATVFPAIATVFFGEAASTNGAFHEALTMAKTFDLPLLFVCENNGVNGNTPADQYMPTELVTHRASGYGFPTNVCDGSDVLAVWEAAQKAIKHVRETRGPYFLECLVQRINRHKVPRMTDVRPEGIKRMARMRDPLPKLKNALIAENLMDEEAAEIVKFELLREIREAVEFAKQSPDSSY
jgi:acetoin:2,6-dichlorophenolindophenol oxidoreductase subunit alpha